MGFRLRLAPWLLALCIGVAASHSRAGDIQMEIGQTSVVHFATGKGCGEAPFWNRLQGRLPRTQVGTFSPGYRSTQYVASCGRSMETQEIIFSAERSGSVSFNLDGERVRISVRKGSGYGGSTYSGGSSYGGSSRSSSERSARRNDEYDGYDYRSQNDRKRRGEGREKRKKRKKKKKHR